MPLGLGLEDATPWVLELLRMEAKLPRFERMENFQTAPDAGTMVYFSLSHFEGSRFIVFLNTEAYYCFLGRAALCQT